MDLKLDKDKFAKEEAKTSPSPPGEETAHERAVRESIEANKVLEDSQEKVEVVEKALAETITEIDVEPDSAGLKLVVTRDNEITLVIGMGLPVEAINSVVNAMLLLKKILHASRGEINGNYAGIVRR